jgi:hypothetical protein
MNQADVERLRNVARSTGSSPNEVAAVLVEEGLRLREFPGIEFRDTPVGRQAYLSGTRLGVWQVIEVMAACATTTGAEKATIVATAEHLSFAPALVTMALAYADAHADEIAATTTDLRALNEQLLAAQEA